MVGASASVRAALGGSDVVLIATAAPGLAFRIYGRPEIQTLQDLRGKRIVQSIAGTDPDVAIQLVLQHENIPFDEVNYVRVETGGDPARDRACAGGAGTDRTGFHVARPMSVVAERRRLQGAKRYLRFRK